MIFKDISILAGGGDEEYKVKENAAIRISGKNIANIWDCFDDADPADTEGEEIKSGKGLLVMSAFFNAHGHSPMTLMRGYGENMTLQHWLFDRIFPFEDKLTCEAVYWGTTLAMAESLRSGIVSTSDMYYFLDDMIGAAADSGAKMNVSRALVNPAGQPFEELVSVREMKDSMKYHGAYDGRILIDASLHAEYTSNEDTAIHLAALTKELGIRMHVHASETASEHRECKERHGGRTPVRYMADCGIFDVPAIAAHCVHIEGEDYDILKEKGVTVAVNTMSNLKLASGVCDVKALLDKGIRVALGTDSVASNNSLSMLEEMKVMSLLAKTWRNDPTIISPSEAIMMATRNGALAQGRDDSGLVREGMRADLVFLRTDTPNMHPVHDILTNIVLSAGNADIAITMADGKILFDNGEFTTIDIEKAAFEAGKAVADIKSRL
ncbi:MAG: amidohydrolase [Firmicutes bacterium]|nr:amidohydrolase [Bacillota bacterium]